MSKKKKDAAPAKEEEPSILSLLIEEHQQKPVEEELANDVSVLFCGMKKSGQTSLIDRFINPLKEEKDQPKPTVALDYKFARYASETSTSKVLAHIYDLGGGDEGSEALVAIATSSVVTFAGNFVVALCVDLSEPHLVVPSLEKWLALLRAQAERIIASIAQDSKGGAKRAEQLKMKRLEAYEEHPDKAQVKPFPFPLVIFGTKCDVFLADVDPEKRKGLCRALRYFSHINGAHLVLTSLKDKTAMNTVRSILRQLLFGIAAKGGIPEQLDSSKPISISAGKDSLQNIGTPQGGKTGEQAWRDMAASLFPDTSQSSSPQKGGAGKRTDSDQVAEELQKHPESSVDGMVEQRIEELQVYRRQVERNQRLASEGLDGNKVGVFAN